MIEEEKDNNNTQQEQATQQTTVHHTSRFSPLLMALCVIIGIMIGTFYAYHFDGARLNVIKNSSEKLNSLLNIINDQYVDEVDFDELIEKALPKILMELDPHSTYISAKEADLYADELAGSFSGIGVEFTIRQDTIRVQNVIAGGPAEEAGLIAGDKIVSVDGKTFVGSEVTNESAMKKLKGEKGSKVKVGVLRYGSTTPKEFTITRGDIPQRSITSIYMMDPETAYMHIKSFGNATYAEMVVALNELNKNGMQKLVIDLRGNGGGYLEAAVQIANEFLDKNELIVYTSGRKSPRRNYYADGHGVYKDIPLVVLIDESTASAAEILAGALQDNDRATIIGRRSFGKGLVQQQIDFSDHSSIRLTVARYYTPSGRCIQKPYTAGDEEDYEMDIVKRYENGEYFSEDSIKHTGKKYHTTKGRVVYGGGGITPDIFVGEDTTNMTSYYKEAVMRGLVFEFAYDYTDNNRNTLSSYGTNTAMATYLHKADIVGKFVTYAEKNGLQRRNLMIKKSHTLLERLLISRIIYNMLDEDEWTAYLNIDDPVVQKAASIIKQGKAWP